MIIEKLVKNYLVMVASPGLKNDRLQCRCNVNNVFKCGKILKDCNIIRFDDAPVKTM